MAQQELSFIDRRAPRAARVSNQAVDAHKELIRELYLEQSYTRDQVVNYLATNLDFILSPDQFSKATRRWGFRKQPRAVDSSERPLNEAVSKCTASDTTSNEVLCTTTEDDAAEQEPTLLSKSSKRPRSDASSISRKSDIRTLGPSSPLPRPPTKRPKPKGDSDKTTVPHRHVNFVIENDFSFTPSTDEATSRYQYIYDDKLSGEYLACCCRYTKAFNCYWRISVPFQYKTYSAKQRRNRILDMARTAKTQRTCEAVRVMMESELGISKDPLTEEKSDQYPRVQAEMCRMQSFLFHCHLAQIYAHRSDGESSVHEHLDKARTFVQKLETESTASTDLWTLFYLLQPTDNCPISESRFDSLKWDNEFFISDMQDCLNHCLSTLADAESFQQALQDYGVGHREMVTPTEMSDLAFQNSPLSLWKKSAWLFTFLWKQMQLENRPPLPWESGLPSISWTQFLMIVSRIIIQRSWAISKPRDDFLDWERLPLELRPSDLQLYRRAIIGLLRGSLFTPEQLKRDFVTEFVAHHSWSPPTAYKSDLSQLRTYQLEALQCVLAAKRDRRSTTPTSETLTEVTSLKSSRDENQHPSTDDEYLNWLVGQQEQLFSTSQRNTINSVVNSRYAPSFDSSSTTSYLRTSISAHHLYLGALNGNPTLARSLVSLSSRSSQVSASSSLRRFKAAALSRQVRPESSLSPRFHYPNVWKQRGISGVSSICGDDLADWQNVDVPMENMESSVDDDSGSLKEVEYPSPAGDANAKLRLEEDAKPKAKRRIWRLLETKGRAVLVNS
ncbi:hypothetical protein FBEOM_4210 [Fusarium beomiforme]|uniref:Clr5 domain-containing protein n=1 Tax=Fusarium beomiforme TaxID=44412 RepID=A0A9P5E189_9HYPO|nr:hypothetical protein FBEOM_4210 [Fusarium beomiforme]